MKPTVGAHLYPVSVSGKLCCRHAALYMYIPHWKYIILVNGYRHHSFSAFCCCFVLKYDVLLWLSLCLNLQVMSLSEYLHFRSLFLVLWMFLSIYCWLNSNTLKYDWACCLTERMRVYWVGLFKCLCRDFCEQMRWGTITFCHMCCLTIVNTKEIVLGRKCHL